MSARKEHLAPNDSSLKAENGSVTLRSPAAFAIGHVTCPDAPFVRQEWYDVLRVTQMMQTSKMRTRLHTSLIVSEPR